MTTSRWVWVVLGACLLVAVEARAQDDRASLAQAREHMEQGQELYGQGRYEEAAREFLAAFDARPFSAFLYNAGVAFERMGDATRAADYFGRYLEREPNAPDAADVRTRIDRLQTAVADAAAAAASAAAAAAAANPPPGQTGSTTTPVEPPPPPPPPVVPPTAPAPPMKSLLSIQTEPDGARVSVFSGSDSVASSPSPFSHTLDEGEYRVVVEHPDYRSVEQRIRIRPGKVYVIIVEMSQGQFLGYLRIVTQPPGARVMIDDQASGVVGTTPYGAVIATGAHRVWVERPGYQAEERAIEVGLGEEVALDLPLTRVTHGRLRVIANVRGARVLVDGEPYGQVPWEGDVPGGVHRVELEADGMKTWSQDVTVPPGQLVPIRARLRPAVSRSGAWVTAAFSLFAAGGGIALWRLSENIEADLRRDRDAGILTSDDPRFFRGKMMTIGADGGFALSALLGILAVYYFVRDPLPDSEGTVLEPRDWALVPSVDPNGRAGRADFRWRF